MLNIIDKKNGNKYDLELQHKFKAYSYNKQKNKKFTGNIPPSFVKLNRKLFTTL